MADILEGIVIDVVDGEMIELEVEHVIADDPGRYGAREFVRVTEGGLASRRDAEDSEAAALMDQENRRVRCYVEERDAQGRIIGEIEVLSAGSPDELADADHSNR